MQALSLCDRHQRALATAVPQGCATCHRLNVERDIVLRVIDALLANGFYLAINDQGGDDDIRPELPTNDRARIVNETMETDDDFLAVYKSPDDARPFGWVRFVYGNDGWDVLSDYTTNLEAHLADVNAYVESIAP